MNLAQPRVNPALGALRPVPLTSQSSYPFAAGMLLVYLFLLVSRAAEMFTFGLGVPLHLTMILSVFLMLAAVLSGRLQEALRTPVVLLFTLFTGWFCLAILTSQWRGGSVMTLTTYWLPAYVAVLLIPSFIFTLDRCRKACYVFAFSLIPILAATVLFRAQVAGRDESSFGSLGNPNDLAFYLLFLIPFAVFVIRSESLLHWRTMVCAGAIAFALVKAMRTGSRSALVAMAVCLLVLFFHGNLQAKVKLSIAAFLLLVMAFAVVPGKILLRYATVFSGTTYEAGMSEDEMSAVDSSRTRKMLFEESIRLMFEHPLFGVGPGIFSAALAKEQQERGQFQTWHEAHNSFSQIGSEMGIPAVILYLSAVIYCMRRTISIYRSTRGDPSKILVSRMAAAMTMSLLIFVISAAFGTYSYTFHFPVLAALVQAFDLCVRKELQAAPRAEAVPLRARPAAPAFNPRVPSYVRNRRLRHGSV